MPTLVVTTFLAVAGGIACTVLYFTGQTTAGPVAFALGSIALVAGSTDALHRL